VGWGGRLRWGERQLKVLGRCRVATEVQKQFENHMGVKKHKTGEGQQIKGPLKNLETFWGLLHPRSTKYTKDEFIQTQWKGGILFNLKHG